MSRPRDCGPWRPVSRVVGFIRHYPTGARGYVEDFAGAGVTWAVYAPTEPGQRPSRAAIGKGRCGTPIEAVTRADEAHDAWRART